MAWFYWYGSSFIEGDVITSELLRSIDNYDNPDILTSSSLEIEVSSMTFRLM